MPTDPIMELILGAVQRLEDRVGKHAAELRAEMANGFRDLRSDFARHEAIDDQVAARVLVIETERSAEAKHAIKRGTWAGIFAAGGMTGAIRVLEHFLK